MPRTPVSSPLRAHVRGCISRRLPLYRAASSSFSRRFIISSIALSWGSDTEILPPAMTPLTLESGSILRTWDRPNSQRMVPYRERRFDTADAADGRSGQRRKNILRGRNVNRVERLSLLRVMVTKFQGCSSKGNPEWAVCLSRRTNALSTELLPRTRHSIGIESW